VRLITKGIRAGASSKGKREAEGDVVLRIAGSFAASKYRAMTFRSTASGEISKLIS